MYIILYAQGFRLLERTSIYVMDVQRAADVDVLSVVSFDVISLLVEYAFLYQCGE